MKAQLVPDHVTPLTLEQAVSAFATAWRVVLGLQPSPAALAALVAGSALETNHWHAIHCWNFGNVKASANYVGLYCQFKCDECVTPEQVAIARKLGPCEVHPWRDGLERVVVWPPHPWSSFRAYETAEDGAAAHVEFLAVDSNHDGHNRYEKAWDRCEAGDAEGFVRALKAARYFTGPVEAYVSAVRQIAAKILPVCERALSGDDHAITDELRAHVKGLVAISLADSARGRDDGPEPFPLA